MSNHGTPAHKFLQAKLVEYLDLMINAEQHIIPIHFEEAALGEAQAKAQAEVLRALRGCGWQIETINGHVVFREPEGFVPTLATLQAAQAEKEKLRSPNKNYPRGTFVLYQGEMAQIEISHPRSSLDEVQRYSIYRTGADPLYIRNVLETELSPYVPPTKLAPLNVVAPTVYLYTDGGASPTNPGWGGWGAVATFDEDNGSEVLGEWHNQDRIASVTNQQMEILAATMGLRCLEHWISQNHSIGEVEVITDSRYVVMGASGQHQRKANERWWKGLDEAVASIGVLVTWHWCGKNTNDFNKIAHDLSQKVR